jgi:hypothetical protein
MVAVDPKQLELLQAKLLAVAQDAYDLLQPGMTLTVSWQEKGDLVIPGQPKKTHTLLITKPGVHWRLRAS